MTFISLTFIEIYYMKGNIYSNPLWIWFFWLISFYVVWVILVFGFGQWESVTDHWPIAVAMALGSYAAGATPMGGGTIGFPMLVMWFDMPASLGRDFSFAIQSIGMTSASILILVRRQRLAKSLLRGAIVGSIIGTPLGIIYIAPYLSELWIKLIFSTIWASFGILHIFRINDISKNIGFNEFNSSLDFKIGFYISLFSTALITSATGVGVDMILYCVLVLLFRADLKIAIPTSVIIMAFTSIVGVITKWINGSFQPGVYENWLSASPIVIIGAPLGVLVVSYLGRKPTLYLVAILCIFQYLWMCVNEYELLKVSGILISMVFVIGAFYLLEILRAQGERLIKVMH
jgi:uncharacterized membrane protein YfcA